ncbi:LLM class flavin-dependent oxidoreductase [Alpinimonas psychrophila]|uniref:Alkanesulfonate monooxygenase SsuD/methylene tetrahydromethanopterin reductase-like flavin-dependent oxidoreductase (Luciferase family) n=1 Tax=Alpinimonas psychrophila TaxID=748908 RepID=A0A7W3JUT9_9MICO|nr:LLM class flavin-dependent oxidoreductase [Alpinimonas psychrophila]MBA8829641.1 alkanesulfonate monooxygenase SsuD/methylene tetrahydromethanopterin reductase-like flavin-dependent oxidoreductase (luciferase family) [Alpinimonas psychrophila]
MSREFLTNTHFKLGLFSPNCSGGMAVTKIPERWSASWDDNLRMAKVADEAGIDFLLPIARWIGYKGETNFHGSVLDPVTWAAGLLAATENITIFATIHTAFNHPLAVAKQMATLDQIGHGRAGLNIVAGWNQPEYEAFGLNLLEAHDDRYALAQEWWDVIQEAWANPGIFDHDGQFFHLKNAESMPKPFDSHMPILNAGTSPQGRGFAAKNSDFVFTAVMGPEDGAEVVTGLKKLATEEYKRDMGVLTFSHVVCRATTKEAEEYRHYYAEENADWGAVDYLMELQGLHAQSFTKEMLAVFRPRFAAGHGGVPLIGTPDEVANEIKRYADAGFAGMTLAFVDYVSELEYFAAEVLPRLEAMGVRLPVSSRVAV